MHNNIKRGRGRPRQFDVDEVLNHALLLFWTNGLNGTSLDDLSVAMKMTRTSLQNAFGSKEAIYRLVFTRFVDAMKADAAVLDEENDIKTALVKFFDRASNVYFSHSPALGCMALCTAPAAATNHPEVRRDLLQLLSQLDEALAKRFSQAVDAGQLAKTLDCKIAAKLVQAVLHSLALRARSGESRVALRKMTRGALEMILAGASK